MIIRKEYRYDQPTSYTCDGICCAVDKSGNERECEMYLYYNGCEVDFYWNVWKKETIKNERKNTLLL